MPSTCCSSHLLHPVLLSSSTVCVCVWVCVCHHFDPAERSRLSGSDPGVICLNDSPALVAAEAAYAALGKGEDELQEWAVV